MTPDGVRSILKSLGWNQATLAQRLGLNQNTVSKWMVGKSKIPRYAGAYLDVVVTVDEVHGRLVAGEKRVSGKKGKEG